MFKLKKKKSIINYKRFIYIYKIWNFSPICSLFWLWLWTDVQLSLFTSPGFPLFFPQKSSKVPPIYCQATLCCASSLLASHIWTFIVWSKMPLILHSFFWMGACGKEWKTSAWCVLDLLKHLWCSQGVCKIIPSKSKCFIFLNISTIYRCLCISSRLNRLLIACLSSRFSCQIPFTSVSCFPAVVDDSWKQICCTCTRYVPEWDLNE